MPIPRAKKTDSTVLTIEDYLTSREDETRGDPESDDAVWQFDCPTLADLASFIVTVPDTQEGSYTYRCYPIVTLELITNVFRLTTSTQAFKAAPLVEHVLLKQGRDPKTNERTAALYAVRIFEEGKRPSRPYIGDFIASDQAAQALALRPRLWTLHSPISGFTHAILIEPCLGHRLLRTTKDDELDV